MSTPVLGQPHAELDFRRLFGIVQSEAFHINVQNGWWNDRHDLIIASLKNGMGDTAKVQVLLALIALVHSELSEAVEAVRKHDPSTWGDAKTKDTLVRELAGTVVRCMDAAEEFDLPLAEAILEELKSNSTRGYRHGGKSA